MVRAHIAGGPPRWSARSRAAEDDAAAGDSAMLGCVRPEDAVVGISASGTAAFVVAAISRAKAIGAYTIALTVDRESALARAAHLAIVPSTGPEVLAGSTRLKAGTAQKVALNAISTAVMARLGKVYDNLMVDVVARQPQLRARALRLVVRLAQVNDVRAEDCSRKPAAAFQLAVLMERRSLGAVQASARSWNVTTAHARRLSDTSSGAAAGNHSSADGNRPVTSEFR